MFRLYLLDNEGHIWATERITNLGVVDAILVSEALYQACTSLCTGYELWAGDTKLANSIGEPLDRVGSEFLNERQREELLALTHRLQEAFPQVREIQQSASLAAPAQMQGDGH